MKSFCCYSQQNASATANWAATLAALDELDVYPSEPLDLTRSRVTLDGEPWPLEMRPLVDNRARSDPYRGPYAIIPQDFWPDGGTARLDIEVFDRAGNATRLSHAPTIASTPTSSNNLGFEAEELSDWLHVGCAVASSVAIGDQVVLPSQGTQMARCSSNPLLRRFFRAPAATTRMTLDVGVVSSLGIGEVFDQLHVDVLVDGARQRVADLNDIAGDDRQATWSGFSQIEVPVSGAGEGFWVEVSGRQAWPGPVFDSQSAMGLEDRLREVTRAVLVDNVGFD